MNDKNITFTLSPEAAALGIKCAVFSISKLSNKLLHSEFDKYKKALFSRLVHKYTQALLSEDPILLGYTLLHEKIACTNRKLIASPQNLINTFLRKGTIPSINLLVDIYNSVSLQNKLSIGAHDIDKLQGNVALSIAKGTEYFVPLGKSKAEKVNAGEYCYIEQNNDKVICRLECRQAEATKISLKTKDALLIVQGNENTSSDLVTNVRQELINLITSYCGGEPKILW